MGFGEAISEGASVERLLLPMNGHSNDASGNGLNGSDSNISYSLANGRFNEAAFFNRSLGASIVIGTSTTIQPTSALTFSMWIKIRNMPTSYCSIGGNDLSGWQRGYNFSIGPSGIVWHIGNGTWGKVQTSGFSMINDGKWHYLVGTWDGSLAKLYIDANLIGQATKTSIVYTSCGFSLGNYYTNTTANIMFDGYLDEVRIRAIALTAAEIQKEFTNALGRF